MKFATDRRRARTFMCTRHVGAFLDAMGDGWNGPLNKVDAFRYEIPRSYKPAMRTNGLVFIDESMVPQLRQDQAKLATEGVGWSVEKGYAWSDDPDHIEARGCLEDADFSKVGERAIARGKDQVGSLGAGNHFVEIQKVDRVDDERAAKALGIEEPGQVCVMVHTGSRGFGHQIATDYIEVCERVVKREKIELPDLQLACAPIGSKEGLDYWRAMCCGANFAWNNRQLITYGGRDAVSKVLRQSTGTLRMG